MVAECVQPDDVAGDAGARTIRSASASARWGATCRCSTHPISQGADITSPAEPENVPDRLSRHVLCQDVQNILSGLPAVYYGVGSSLALYVDGALALHHSGLRSGGSGWELDQSAGSRGPGRRLIRNSGGSLCRRLPSGTSPQVQASFYYGFNADMGGGEYPRSGTFTASPEQPLVRVPGDYATIHQALAVLGGDGVVEITDSAIYGEPTGLSIAVKASGHIELRAADGCRPTLILGGEISVTGAAESSLDLNGLVIAYAPPALGAPIPPALVHVPASGANQMTHLGIDPLHPGSGWALDPDGDPQPAYFGLPTVLVESAVVEIVIQKSIVGRMWINVESTASLPTASSMGPTWRPSPMSQRSVPRPTVLSPAVH